MVLTIKFNRKDDRDILWRIAERATDISNIDKLFKLETGDIFRALFYNNCTPINIKEQIKEACPDVTRVATELYGLGPDLIEFYRFPYEETAELTLNFEEMPDDLAHRILAYHVRDEETIAIASQTDNTLFIKALIINIYTTKSIREILFNKCRDFIDCYGLKESLMCMPLNSNTIRMLIETDIEKKTSSCFSEMLQQEDVSSEDLMIMVGALSECCSPSLAKTIACNIINHQKCNDAIFDKAILHLTR